MSNQQSIKRMVETLLNRQHVVYRRLGLADIDKHEAGTMTHRGQTFRVSGGRPDYRGGCRALGGVDVVIEAKATSKGRLLWSRIKDHQRARLQASLDAGGGLVMLVIGLVDGPRVTMWAVPYRAFAEATEGGKSGSWRAEDMDVVGVRLRGADWLKAVQMNPGVFGLGMEVAA